MKPVIRNGPEGDFFVPKTRYYVIANDGIGNAVRAIAPCKSWADAVMVQFWLGLDKRWKRVQIVSDLPRQQRGNQWVLRTEWHQQAKEWSESNDKK